MLSSVVLRTAVRLIFPLALGFAIYAALKGHNEPGGGFIAGLIASVALGIHRMSYGAKAFHRVMPIHPRWLVFGGLALAASVAFIPVLLGEPLLRSTSVTIHLGDEELHLVSATAFDLGVLFVVIGVAVGIVTRLSEELEP